MRLTIRQKGEVNGAGRVLFTALPAAATLACMELRIFSAVAFPLLMALGGIAAWRMSKKQVEESEKPAWRDDSLDDWRKERDAQAEQARSNRPAELREMRTGQEEQQETAKPHQRIGG